MQGWIGGVLGLAVGLGVPTVLVLGTWLRRRQQLGRAPGPLTVGEAAAALRALETLSVIERKETVARLNRERVRWRGAYKRFSPHRRTNGGFATFSVTLPGGEASHFLVDVTAAQRAWLDAVRPGEEIDVEGTLLVYAASPLLNLAWTKLSRALA